MSRIGKKLIKIPTGTEAIYADGLFSVKGPQGSLNRLFKKEINITIADGSITLSPISESIENRALWGTYGSHITNMILGVNTLFVKKLILEGIGYKSEVKGNKIDFALGFSHPVSVDIPVSLKVTAEKNVITVSGIDKEMVGSFSASLRALKKPEPYKGKGMRYDDEKIKRKQGKKSA